MYMGLFLIFKTCWLSDAKVEHVILYNSWHHVKSNIMFSDVDFYKQIKVYAIGTKNGSNLLQIKNGIFFWKKVFKEN